MMKGLQTYVKKGVRFIKFDQPQRKNALTPDLYAEITRVLNEDAQSDEIVVTVFTGTGEYFTSGNDLSGAMQSDVDPEELARRNFLIFKQFVDALINYPKVLIAVVNGPAIGIGVTMLALCDVVYASDTATFHAPFVNLGLCAEACSSYTFARIMGRSKASEILLLGRKISAQEAYQCGLVASIVPREKLDVLYEDLLKYGGLPVKTVRANKKLLMAEIRNVLCECNERECEALIEAVKSEDFFNSIAAFMSRKSKL